MTAGRMILLILAVLVTIFLISLIFLAVGSG
jgi:hypothetical protein